MAGTIQFNVHRDLDEVDRFLTDVEQRVGRQAAASAMTGLVREARRNGLTEIKGRLGLSGREVSKRVRVWRASPRRLVAGIIANTRDIPEVSVGARQVGHPGRPRTSNTKAALRARRRRKAQGAKPPRSGGVRSKGRSYPKAWIGFPKGKRDNPQAMTREGNDIEVLKRDWSPALRILDSQVTAVGPRWSGEFAKRFTAALRRRGRGGTATFLESTETI